MAVWEEIVDYTVPTSTNSTTISGLNITKDDFIKVNITHFVNNNNGTSLRWSVNGDSNESNYYRQFLQGNGSSLGLVLRAAAASIAGTSSLVSSPAYSTTYFKVSENNKVNSFSNGTVVSSSPDVTYVYSTTTANHSSITSLTIYSSAGGTTLSAGTRIQIYRLTAQKVADITVASNTTQVDITGLNIDKSSEYLLIGDFTASVNTPLDLFINNDTNLSNYYSQLIEAYGSTSNAARLNRPYFSYSLANNTSLNYAHLKLSNIGSFTHQSYRINSIGTSNVGLTNYFSSTTSETINSVSEINIKAGDTNAIVSGSRFQLYKLY